MRSLTLLPSIPTHFTVKSPALSAGWHWSWYFCTLMSLSPTLLLFFTSSSWLSVPNASWCQVWLASLAVETQTESSWPHLEGFWDAYPASMSLRHRCPSHNARKDIWVMEAGDFSPRIWRWGKQVFDTVECIHIVCCFVRDSFQLLRGYVTHYSIQNHWSNPPTSIIQVRSSVRLVSHTTG